MIVNYRSSVGFSWQNTIVIRRIETWRELGRVRSLTIVSRYATQREGSFPFVYQVRNTIRQNEAVSVDNDFISHRIKEHRVQRVDWILLNNILNLKQNSPSLSLSLWVGSTYSCSQSFSAVRCWLFTDYPYVSMWATNGTEKNNSSPRLCHRVETSN